MPVILAAGRQRSRGYWFEASLGKKFMKPPSQPMAGCGSICLSSKLYEEAQIGGSCSRLARHTVIPHLKNN
jgi:hypothetical protein